MNHKIESGPKFLIAFRLILGLNFQLWSIRVEYNGIEKLISQEGNCTLGCTLCLDIKVEMEFDRAFLR